MSINGTFLDEYYFWMPFFARVYLSGAFAVSTSTSNVVHKVGPRSLYFEKKCQKNLTS